MNRRYRSNPSFSSSLLDEIYRSIDGVGERKKDEEEIFNYNRKRTAVKGGFDCESMATRHQPVNNWSSSSGSVKGFSSFEVDSRSSGFMAPQPRPIRTGFSVQHEKFEPPREQKPTNENRFGKTKSKAMKLYGDLKKVKQPISPGGRLATFLNSLFTTRTPKKAKISSSMPASFDETISRNNPESQISSCTSTCSSASSFSGSCLSNSSSRDKICNGTERSVRFYPVSVIIGEDNRPMYKSEVRNTIDKELKLRIMEKNHRVEEAARDFLKNYQKVEYDYFNVLDTRMQNGKRFGDVDDEDDDAASYASSDLFELDHLSAIEELPVYETTHLRTNLAIANGLIS